MSVVTKAIAEFPFSGRNLLVSCSGGVDSMVLLHALVNAGLKPEVAHINYHLRGEDSDADQKLVEDISEKLGLKCAVYHCPAELTLGEGKNLQSAARDFRRRIYNDWIAANKKNAVVLAHHSDDQVETFFLQLFRGSGSLGLGGMFADKNGILRPLLEVSRKDILEYANERQVAWREDQSNQSVKYLRNLFRNKLLPELRSGNVNLQESVAVLMKAFRNQRELNEEKLHPLVSEWKNGFTLALADWIKMREDQQLLFLQLVGLPVWVKERIPELEGSQKLEIGDSILVLDKKSLKLVKPERDLSWDFKIEEVEFLPEKFSKDEIFLDAEKVEVSKVLIRSAQTGDRIKSLGLSGSQLVSDILKDAGVADWKRKEVPVVVCGEEILWIPGYKIGKFGLAHRDSQKKIRLTIC